MAKIFGTKEQRMAEKERKDEETEKKHGLGKKNIPYMILLILLGFAMLFVAERL